MQIVSVASSAVVLQSVVLMCREEVEGSLTFEEFLYFYCTKGEVGEVKANTVKITMALCIHMLT